MDVDGGGGAGRRDVAILSVAKLAQKNLETEIILSETAVRTF